MLNLWSVHGIICFLLKLAKPWTNLLKLFTNAATFVICPWHQMSLTRMSYLYMAYKPSYLCLLTDNTSQFSGKSSCKILNIWTSPVIYRHTIKYQFQELHLINCAILPIWSNLSLILANLITEMFHALGHRMYYIPSNFATIPNQKITETIIF
jgi:hypothetical protein